MEQITRRSGVRSPPVSWNSVKRSLPVTQEGLTLRDALMYTRSNTLNNTKQFVWFGGTIGRCLLHCGGYTLLLQVHNPNSWGPHAPHCAFRTFSENGNGNECYTTGMEKMTVGTNGIHLPCYGTVSQAKCSLVGAPQCSKPTFHTEYSGQL